MSSPVETYKFGSDAVTQGVRVQVRPIFMPEHSNSEQSQYVFAYTIRIANEGEAPARLVSRHWIITDADGEVHEVRGEGVVGQQPYLLPGQSFEYSSYCPIRTSWGTMEGTYQMVRDSGEGFDARIKRFFLVAHPAEMPDEL